MDYTSRNLHQVLLIKGDAKYIIIEINVFNFIALKLGVL